MVILVDLLKQQTGYLVRLFFEKLVRSCLYFLFRFPKSSNTYADSNILYFVFIIVGIFSRLTPAVEMVDVFFKTEFEGGRHQKRVDKIKIKKNC